MLDNFMSYFVGLMQTDGHHSPKYGNIRLEINDKDKDIIYKLQQQLAQYGASITKRARVTNFTRGQPINFISLYVDSRKLPLDVGINIPTGKKSAIINVPSCSYSEVDYWRGIIDGDGSLGFRGKYNAPYISLVTASEYLYLAYREFIKRIIGVEINLTRNKRDNVYNIVLGPSASVKLISILYYDNCLSIDRKQLLSDKIKLSTPRRSFIRFSKEDVDVIRSNNDIDAANILNRSVDSIKNKRYMMSKR